MFSDLPPLKLLYLPSAVAKNNPTPHTLLFILQPCQPISRRMLQVTSLAARNREERAGRKGLKPCLRSHLGSLGQRMGSLGGKRRERMGLRVPETPLGARGCVLESGLPHLRNEDGISREWRCVEVTFRDASEPSRACRSSPGAWRGPRTGQSGGQPRSAPQLVPTSPGWPGPGGRAARSPQGAPQARRKPAARASNSPGGDRASHREGLPSLAAQGLGPAMAFRTTNRNAFSPVCLRLERGLFSSPAQSRSCRAVAPGLEDLAPGFSNLNAEATALGQPSLTPPDLGGLAPGWSLVLSR